MKSKKFSNKKIFLFFLIVCFLLIVIFLQLPVKKEFVKTLTTESGSNLFYKFDTIKYPSNVQIVGKGELTLGFVTDPWNLNFGTIPITANETRFISLRNSEDKNAKVSIKAFGNISQLVRFSKNNFILKPNENITIEVLLVATEGIKTGNYTGEIDVTIKKPNFDFIYYIWNIF